MRPGNTVTCIRLFSSRNNFKNQNDNYIEKTRKELNILREHKPKPSYEFLPPQPELGSVVPPKDIEELRNERNERFKAHVLSKCSNKIPSTPGYSKKIVKHLEAFDVITAENVVKRAKFAAENEVDYNFAIRPNGDKLLGRFTMPTKALIKLHKN